MKRNRLIHLIVLVSFLPLAFGCSSRTTISMDPDQNPETDPLKSGKPKKISGYTLVTGDFRDWYGTVQAVPPDSLQFKGNKTFQESERENLTLRFSRSDIGSVTQTELAEWKSIGLFLVALIGISLLSMTSEEASYWGM